MKEKGENMWLINLPAHTPPEDMWERIETRMDNDIANERFQEQLARLPEHAPPAGLWSLIEQGLVFRKVVRLGFIAAGIAATLLLAFILKGVLLPESIKVRPGRSLAISPIEKQSPYNQTGKPNHTGTFSLTDQKKQIIVAPVDLKPASAEMTDLNESKLSATVVNNINVAPGEMPFLADYHGLQGISFPMLPVKIKTAIIQSSEHPSLSPSIISAIPGHNIPEKDTLSGWLLARNSNANVPPPPLPANITERKGISIGFNYLPEPMSQSDEGSSSYQTFALMAQYQMPSIDIRTGLGISYQSAPMEYKTDYISFSANSGYGSDTLITNGDTLVGAFLDAGAVNITGKERASFLYYSIGAGKRIYSNKRISTSLRVGAGFGLLLSNQNKPSGRVYDALIKQSNTILSNTKSNIPEINQTHFDLVTGFDFNYRLHKRWSLSIEPTLKYYFNPVYNGNNARSFSTGLRTGILYKL